MPLQKVTLLRSPDGRLWNSEEQYEKAKIEEELELKIKPLAKRFLDLCTLVVEVKSIPEQNKQSRAFTYFLRENKDILRVFME